MAINHIISQCSSVDDLRCHLRYLTPITRLDRQEAKSNLDEAIKHETATRNRITVIKMLQGKIKAIQKELSISY